MLELPINTIICGDCLEVMRGLPDNCIDTIITDPPYGLEFMGKEWDKFGVSEGRAKRLTGGGYYKETGKYDRFFNYRNGSESRGRYTEMTCPEKSAMQEFFYQWAKEILRIAKPGTIMLVFGGTRTYHRLACAIEDAGWQIRDCMMWLYGSGFPKSANISLMFDKRACLEQLTKKLSRKPNKEELKKEWENFREVIGEGTRHTSRKFGKGVGDADYGTYAGGIPNITAPTTNLAKLWDGYGTALKPAWEPIIVAMKPLDGTFAQNAEKWGVAGLNIDGGRIGYQSKYDKSQATPQGKCTSKEIAAIGAEPDAGRQLERVDFERPEQKGRWPANIILDEEAAAMLDEQAPSTGAFAKVKSGQSGKSKGIYHDYAQKGDDGASFHNDGLQGASRFFYCAKASRAERNAGLEGMQAKPIKGRDAGQDTRNVPYKQRTSPVQNSHPTVKPLKLMEYLCNLTKIPTGGIVLDPFGGSGTTALACINTGRNYILVEKEKDYCEIAKGRTGNKVEIKIPQKTNDIPDDLASFQQALNKERAGEKQND